MRARLAERGFPCARPLTPAVAVGTSAAHAEVYRSGGDLLLLGDGPDVAERYAAVFARLMADLADARSDPRCRTRVGCGGSAPTPACGR